jgi:hypothetical protein
VATGVLVLEHNTFSLPPDGAITVFDSSACDIHVLRNRFTYASYWKDPGLGTQVLSSERRCADAVGQ